MQEKLLCHVGVPAPCRRRQRDGGHQCLHSGERIRRHVRTSCQRTKRQRDSGHQCSHSGERTRRHVRTRRQRTRSHPQRISAREPGSQDNIAEALTKSLPASSFLRHREFLFVNYVRAVSPLILFTDGIEPSLLFFGGALRGFYFYCRRRTTTGELSWFSLLFTGLITFPLPGGERTSGWSCARTPSVGSA